MDIKELSVKDFEELTAQKAARIFGVKPSEASEEQMYRSVCMVIRDLLTEKRVGFKRESRRQELKQVYYMSMEFLLGRSLKNHLFNLCITDKFSEAISNLGFDLERLYEFEPDAGLGNGGLGRLAAAYMDSLTSGNYLASGFSIRYDYGIFKQKIVDGWQVELADDWLENGNVWLSPRTEDSFEVHFGGIVDQEWTPDGKLQIHHRDYDTIIAVPYDMNITGYQADAVNTIKLWTARSPIEIDMNMFSRGEYVKAMESKALAESISKILYPADNHVEGKSLRLKQQYFFVSASLQLIIAKHIKYRKDLYTLPKYVAIHINDTHPTLCIPELMRLLMDEHDMSWDDAWHIVKETVSYTNHTVMAEALEKWPENLFAGLLPRIYQIVCEINRRYCEDLFNFYPNDWGKVSYNAIISHGEVKMANMCLCASHTVNGVSALHSDILKNTIFHDCYLMEPKKFTNVTNGITHRRWLCEANPELSQLIEDCIGPDFISDASYLADFLKFQGDKDVLARMETIKRNNKLRLIKYVREHNGIDLDPDSIFHAQVKRLHEYKRQLLNALHILDLYYTIKENPAADITPQTFIFGAKAAGSYYMAKQIIRLICMMAEVINNDPDIKGRIKIVFLENYRVTLAELIMPATEVSEQISIAGKEASGTGNMKFMINGAITMGTLDGANVEISENVGEENIFIFGLLAEQVADLYRSGGYQASSYYNNNPDIKRVIDNLRRGINGVNFGEIADSLTLGRGGMADPYMVLADFASYKSKQAEMREVYAQRERWNRMSLVNVAKSGFFSSDRSIKEYCDRIWAMNPLK